MKTELTQIYRVQFKSSDRNSGNPALLWTGRSKLLKIFIHINRLLALKKRDQSTWIEWKLSSEKNICNLIRIKLCILLLIYEIPSYNLNTIAMIFQVNFLKSQIGKFGRTSTGRRRFFSDEIFSHISRIVWENFFLNFFFLPTKVRWSK